MASQTEENYLKSLYALAMGNQEVGISEIANLLHVSLPTVNSMMKKLQLQGLVNYQKYKPVALTPAGEKAAALVLRKHRLTEMYLVTKMGFGWEEVHEIAELVEHIDSAAFFERMDEILGYPATDPHGSPIPDKDGNVARISFEALSNCRVGAVVTLLALANSSKDFLIFLNRKELVLGTLITIISVEPYDQSMMVSYSNHPTEVLSRSVCESLLVGQGKV